MRLSALRALAPCTLACLTLAAFSSDSRSAREAGARAAGAGRAEPTRPARAPRVDDLALLREISAPRISPDGRSVAYAVTEIDVAADEHRSDIWVTRWDGAQSTRLTNTPQSEHSPRWSPDGRWLAFLSSGAGPAAADQLWLIDPGGGTPEPVTALDAGVTDFDWAPDSRRIVAVSDVALSDLNRDVAAVRPASAGTMSTPTPIVIDRLLFKRDGYGYLARARSRLHLLDFRDRSVVQLTDGPHDEILPAFSPDGARIAFVTKLGADPDSHGDWDILAIEPVPGAKPRRVSESDFMECDPVWGWGSRPVWSPDSLRIACVQSGPLALSWFSLQQLAIFPAQGGRAEQPTAALDRNTTRPRFSADGSRVYFLLEEEQTTLLASSRLDGSDLRRLTPADRSVAEYDLGADGRIAVLSSSSDAPPEISVLDAGTLREITQVNAELRASVQLVRVESLSFRAADGTALSGLLMKPAASRDDARLPTILRLHGGPVAQWQHQFDLDWQILAARGYAVFGPNPRGSSGRGEQFQRAIFGDWGNADVKDVLAAADHLVATGIADPDRLGIGGWSAGAMLTNYVVASDTRFKAATSGAGVSNMLAGYGTDEWWQDWEAELGAPWESPEKWLRVSYPFLHANRIRTPTLFLCGEQDFNVPAIHSEQMYLALRRLGVPTRLVIYPGESHGISRPRFQRDVLERYLAWYDEWLRADVETADRAPKPTPRRAAR
ncbi:MAG TPA: S9 family peptidase [Myxococcota bacterium]|nr:S9 family peptidase [Myxococcota bacterium]